MSSQEPLDLTGCMEVDVPTTQEEEAEPYWFLEEDIPIWLDEAMLLRRADLIEDTMKELQAYGQKALYSSIQYRVQVRSALYSINVTSGETNQKINVLHLCRCVQEQLCLGSLLAGYILQDLSQDREAGDQGE